jgi:hypothetical protein
MASDEGDELEDLLGRYVDRLNDGERLDPEAVLAENPVHGPEIVAHLESFIESTVEKEEPQRVLGDYTLLRQVGRGGMGVVYEAWQRSMDRRVALKVLPAGLLADPRAVTRFRREAKLAGRLHHPNVVLAYGMGVEDGVPCFAMEFVDGETLEQVLRRSRPAESQERRRWRTRLAASIARAFSDKTPTQHQPQPGTEAEESRELAPVEGESGLTREIDLKYCLRMAEAFAGAADGLQHAHGLGIIHRDLKPSNLILDRGSDSSHGDRGRIHGRLRILDFGLARLQGQESLTASGEFLGTPRYMSPEQAKAEDVVVDHRTDIYSLGATLYEILTWRPPFEGKDYQDTIHQIIHRELPPLHRLNPRIPKDLETIVAKCMQKEPRERYGTAEALAQDLRRFVRGDPIEARPQPSWERVARRAWRHKGRIGATALIAALILTLASVVLENSRQDRLRRIAEYEPKVIRAVMKMQQGRRSLEPEPTTPASSMDEEGIFGFDFQTLVESSGRDPVEEAVEELAEAESLLPQRPDAHFHRARGLFVLGRTEEALEETAHALEANAGFVPARILLAAVLERQGNHAGAKAEMKRASRSAAKGWAELWLAAHLAMAERRWQDAAAAYEKIIATAGGEPYLGSSAETRLGRGVARLESMEFVGAIEDFVAAGTLWPDSLEPGLLLGKAYFLQGNKDRAEITFKGLLERARIPDEVATATAAVYSSLKEYDLGLQWAEKVSELSLRERLRSAFLYKMGRTPEAREAGKKAVTANSSDAQAYLALAQADYAEGAPVTDLLRKAIELDPKNSYANVWLAHDLTSAGKPEEAQVRLQSAIRLEPRSPYGHYALAKMYEQKGKLLEAFLAYMKAVELAPDALAPQAGTNMIQLLKRKEKPKLPVRELIQSLEKALSSKPEHPALLLRVLALAEVHDPEAPDAAKALQHATLAVELTRRLDPDMLGALAEVRFTGGDAAQAVWILEEAVRLPDASRRLLSDLEEYRRALLPRRVSYASIDAALEASEMEALVPEGASWRFFRGRSEPSPALEWTARAFDDSAWETGPSGFGYGDADDATLLDDMRGSYTTVYVRKLFSIPDPSRYRRFLLSVRADDGFVAYLNGVEVGRARAGKPGARVPSNGTATFATEAPLATPVWVDVKLFRAGENCLAIQGLNCSLGSSDLSLVPVLEGEVSSGAERDRRLLESFRAAAGVEHDDVLSYLEAAVLQRAGEHLQAAAKLRLIVNADASRPEPLLRLADNLAAAGDSAAAEAQLREVLARGLTRDERVWDRWLELSFIDLRHTVDDVLSVLSLPSAKPALEGYGADVRWLLERLSAAEAIRIRCGGDEYKSRKGTVWGKDRFYRSGHAFSDSKAEDPLRSAVLSRKEAVRSGATLPPAPGQAFLWDVANTGDDPLYYSERHFNPDDIHAPSYRVPLPPGEYEVTLHFAEIVHKTKGKRRFDVSLEGRKVLEEYELSFGVATKHSSRCKVTDGFLDIEFGFVMEEPKISAIKIEKAE